MRQELSESRYLWIVRYLLGKCIQYRRMLIQRNCDYKAKQHGTVLIGSFQNSNYVAHGIAVNSQNHKLRRLTSHRNSHITSTEPKTRLTYPTIQLLFLAIQ